MGFAITKQRSEQSYNYTEFVCDTVDDLANIDVTRCSVGSNALVIDGSKVFVLNTDKEWKEI